jgi:prefoldin subunit 5
MNTIIKIEKEDIITSRLGMNVEVQISPNTSLVFTTDALDELVKDYAAVKEEIQKTTSQIVEALRTAKDISQLEIPFDDETRS